MNNLSPLPPVERQVRCWCGNGRLEDFSPDYWLCTDCQTLVLREMRGEEISLVRNDDSDFYGKNYYLQHVQQDYGLPDLETRARADLTERCLHWLRTLLKYVPDTGARTLELGCGHGGFVAMQRWAGLDATGLELSPWLVQRAREWFAIPILEGRLEDQDLAPASLDAVVSFDVLEHLPDPRGSLTQAISLLRSPESFLLMQTPCYPVGVSYEEMLAQNHPFLVQLKPMEHLYLFSKESVARLCAELGLGQVRFEPAIFAHYDLFAVASASPLQARSKATRTKALLTAPPSARSVLALLDLAEERDDLNKRFAEVSASETTLSEATQRQGAEITRLHAEVDRWLRETRELWPRLNALENERNLAHAQLNDVRNQFEAVEADNAARLGVIEQQGTEIARLHSEVDRQLKTATDFWPKLDVVSNERNLLAAQIQDLQTHLDRSEADRAARLQVIEQQGAEISYLHGQTDYWLHQAAELWPKLNEALNLVDQRSGELADLRGRLQSLEADDTARLNVIKVQQSEIEHFKSQLAASQSELARTVAEMTDLHREHRALGERQTKFEQHWTTRMLRKLGLGPS